MNHYQQFTSGIRWSMYEQFFYQTALVIHQVLLCSVIGLDAYGLVGTTISGIYLVSALATLGLDVSLGPLLPVAAQSKSLFKRIILSQLFTQWLLILPLFIGLYFFIPHSFDSRLLPLAAAIALSEGFKKIIRAILHGVFIVKKIVLIEIGMISGYVGGIWILYFFGFFPSLFLQLILLFISSACSLIALIAALSTYYHSLAETPLELPSGIWSRIITIRFMSAVHHLIGQCLSSNSAIPFFAYTFGMQHAGLLTLASSVVYYLTTIIKKVFGPMSGAAIAHAKEHPISYKQELFFRATNALYYPLVGITGFIILFYPIIARFFVVSWHLWMPIYLYLLMSIAEHFCITYEKFFLTEEKIHYINLIHASYLVFFFLIIHAPLPSLFMLITLFCARLISLAIIMLTAFFLWSLHPFVLPRPFFYGIVTSLACIVLINLI